MCSFCFLFLFISFLIDCSFLLNVILLHIIVTLINKQVSPFEVEEPLLGHPWIHMPVCFSVPSKLYGEEVGCALVLSPLAPSKDDPDLYKNVTAEMRAWMKEAKMAPVRHFYSLTNFKLSQYCNGLTMSSN